MSLVAICESRTGIGGTELPVAPVFGPASLTLLTSVPFRGMVLVNSKSTVVSPWVLKG